MIEFDDYIGIEISKEGDGLAKIALKEEHFNAIGTVHGGVIMTLCDTTCGYYTHYITGKAPATVDGSFNFLNPCFGGKYLYANAKIIKAGKNLVTLDCDVEDDNKRLIATSRFTFFALDKDVIRKK